MNLLQRIGLWLFPGEPVSEYEELYLLSERPEKPGDEANDADLKAEHSDGRSE